MSHLGLGRIPDIPSNEMPDPDVAGYLDFKKIFKIIRFFRYLQQYQRKFVNLLYRFCQIKYEVTKQKLMEWVNRIFV